MSERPSDAAPAEETPDTFGDSLLVEKNQTAHRSRIDARSLFVFIGATPGTRWLAHSVALDERVASAVGDGAIAVSMVHERLRGEAG